MAAAATPRKKLPPPTTMPIWTPVLATSAISAARLLTRSGSMPKAPPPASASPLSLRTMRLYLGIGYAARTDAFRLFVRRGFVRRFLDQRRFADFEAHEARDRDVFAQLRDYGFNQIAHRGGILANEGLLVQTHLFEEFLHAPFGDLVHHLFGLAFLQGPAALDVA